MVNRNVNDSRMVMKGVLSVLSLPGLIQTIDTKKKIEIILKPKGQKKGKLYFSDGRIVHASIGDVVLGKKAFFRMMGWQDIPFEMFELVRDSEIQDPNISVDTMELIIDGTRQVDEIKMLEGKLPLYYKLKPGDISELELNDGEEEIFSLITTGDFVRDVLNKNPDDDLNIYRVLADLAEKKAITFLRIKVLIIDDNRFFAGIINDVIEKLFKDLFTTLVVDSGDKGIKVIESEQSPDLVISDLIMEGKDGLDVVEASNKKDIPSIILTSERRNMDKIIESGATYMHKSVLGTDEFTEIFQKAIFDILKGFSYSISG